MATHMNDDMLEEGDDLEEDEEADGEEGDEESDSKDEDDDA